MTREAIIRMAREAGINGHNFAGDTDILARFATLVAAAERKRLEATAWGASKKWIVEAVAAEREACAKLCESLFDLNDDSCNEAEKCAAAIRARGKE